MNSEQMNIITRKLEDLYQQRWLNPLCGIEDAVRRIEAVQEENKYRIYNHGLAHDGRIIERKFGDMTLQYYLRYCKVWLAFVKEDLHSPSAAAKEDSYSPSAAKELKNFVRLVASDPKPFWPRDMSDFVEKSWGYEPQTILEVKDFLENKSEQFFKTLGDFVEEAGAIVYGWVNTCDRNEGEAEDMLMEEFGMASSPKPKKSLRVTVEEV